MTRSAARDLAFHLIFERAFRDESMEEIIADAEEARAIEDPRPSTMSPLSSAFSAP